MENLKLTDLYNAYLGFYHTTGKRQHPNRLLAMLLLPEKDNYEPLQVEEGQFYEVYKKEIDVKIEKVTNDFHITEEEIVRYIERTNRSLELNFEHEKIWSVFSEGFGAMHWGIMYKENDTPEQIYCDYFDASKLFERRSTFKIKKIIRNSNKLTK